MMKPVQNYYSKYITFFDKMDDDRFIENYFAMEKWTNDNIPVAEVTRDEYSAWLALGPSTVVQSPECAWNVSFLPEPACMADASVCTGQGCGLHPQVCVDYCDADAYCSNIGKHLCILEIPQVVLQTF